MFYELRRYHILPGKQAEWVRLMEEEIIPFQVSKGMVPVGTFVGEEDETVFVWMRRFESEEERERLYAAVYDSDHWKEIIAPRATQLMDRDAMVVTRILPTAKSVLH